MTEKPQHLSIEDLNPIEKMCREMDVIARKYNFIEIDKIRLRTGSVSNKGVFPGVEYSRH